ncbi:N-acetylmuramoyl-L-alanine amidase [Deinococcus ficus]|uniref:N-acetylmuramoyl-L-alanine amidase n=1 Tax=Deinococcus ficus TaxID=317577 RepID=UPI00174A8A42|nr:N-acetylmuramoyl-L-alanine amidase [Deinococcus ficus]GHF83058.1 N-acetylmuramoyl-L-alanine amidase [Deinococcus ficus]
MRSTLLPRLTRAAFTAVLTGAVLTGAARAAPAIFVAYPESGARVAFDHVILQGSVTPGSSLSVSGKAVKVGPDGLFMAWWPLRAGTNDLKLVSTRAGQTATQILRVIRPVVRPLPATPTSLDRASLEPRVNIEYWDAGGDTDAERQVTVAFRGSPGGKASARLPGVTVLPLREVAAGQYRGTYTLPAGATLPAAAFEVSLTGRDGRTVTAPTPGRLSSVRGPRTGTQRPDTVQGLGLNEATWVATDLTGRPALYPRAGMTFPLVGRVGDDVRARIAPGTSLLITAKQLEVTPGLPLPVAGGPVTLDGEGPPSPALSFLPGPAGTPEVPSPVPTPPLAPMSSAPAHPELVLRLPLGGARLPFTITQTDGGRRLDVLLYGTLAAPLLPPAGRDTLLRAVEVTPAGPGVTRVSVLTTAPQAWGFTVNYDGPDLRVAVRRPPPLDAAQPLLGRAVTLDPGHGGSQRGGAGSLRVPEKDLNLPIALRVAELLRAQGATVHLTRDTDLTLGLYERGLTAETTASDLLVSIHANALPDGRDPRGVRGPEVYFTHPQAQGAAARILAQLRQRLPDLGPGKGLMPGADLALTRPGTQPSLLIETGYLTDAGNLRLLMSPAGRERLAQAIAAGIGDFYAAQARQP